MRKVKLISTVLISILIISGCSMNKDKNVDKATQQKNITKVQNDISEIMGKDYDYVVKNMGKPYLTTYYINIDKFKNCKNLDFNQLLSKLDIELVYPKEGYENSALYVDIDNNKVVDVKTNEFVGVSSGFENLPEYASSSNVIIDFYNKQKYLSMDKLKGISLKSYEGKSIKDFAKETGLDAPNAFAYSENSNKIISYYILDNNKDTLEDIIAVAQENDKITSISQVSKSSIVNSLAKLIN
ncbi:MAG: hypothetical protein E7C86_00110 [Paeniclostridium sordellii]|uniref:Lipoprotein n=1 Tax=Paeniclostridium hominis TaxID=2764329 RepID=A0ABR7K004_9FIRM|nr:MULTISPECIES: hypothetical protein [Paeniclostridium]MBC6002209.1 hypothetical protein [Paeniclostridium hominis]MDU2591006.1 hypothetical protein [Paeniclostridium sordellii]